MLDRTPIASAAPSTAVGDPAAPAVEVAVEATAWRAGRAQRVVERLAEETALAIEVGGIAHAVMLATPADLEDFALGFLLSEGLIDHRRDLLDCEVEPLASGLALRLGVVQRCLHRFKERRRALAGRTGCGLCGTESIDEAVRPVRRVQAGPPLSFAALSRGMAALASGQALQRATGATHAAAWLDRDGALQLVREDVGRHNALDKLLGAMARADVDPASGFIAVTSRASYEMVHKTASAGVSVLAAISAPTALAARIAAEAGLTLAGFARDDRATLYSHPQGIAAAS